MRLLSFVTLAMTGIALAAGSALPLVVKESVTAPSNWIRRGPAPDSHVLDLHFGLKQRAMDDLETKLLDIADPDSASYGQWLTKENVESYMQPRAESAAAVKRWLSGHGIQDRKRSDAGDWMSAQMTVAQARSVLGADFSIFENRETGEQLVRTTEYSVPRDIHEHLDLVSPTTYFRTVRSMTTQSSGIKMEDMPLGWTPTSSKQRNSAASDPQSGVPAECDPTAVTMTCLRKYYGTYDYQVKSKKNQFIGVSGFLEQYASYSDLKEFESTQRPDAAAANYSFSLVKIAGGKNNQSDAGIEANLDTQTVAGIAFPIPETYYSVGGRPPFKPDENTPTNTNEPYTTEFEYLLSRPDRKLPSVQSTSYGDDEQTVPLAYQRRVCHEALALGARGVTLFFSSGDFGVGANGTCVSNNGSNKRMFIPAFPASCPYVTTVGGTQNFAPERTVGPSFFGGGGFSKTWPMPQYQKSVVEPYIQSLGNEYAGLYNRFGRGYPDLSGQSLDYVIVYKGKYVRVSGTSASAPLLSSIFALVNDQRLSEGKSTLGFLNPALYKSRGAGLKDITVGSNAGCNTAGFPATKGWDAATGFGTPQFAGLLQAYA